MNRRTTLFRNLLAPLALAPLLLTFAAAVARAQASEEVWHLMYFDEAKVGFVHGITEPVEKDGRKLIKNTVDSSVTINRLGRNVTVLSSGWSLEGEKGDLVELHSEQNLAAAKTIRHLWRDGDNGRLETKIGGPTQKQTIEWNKEWLGDSGADDFRKARIEKGEKEFSYSTYTLEAGEATITSKVVGKEKVEVKGLGSRELLHLSVANSAVPVQTDEYLDDKCKEVMTVTRMMGIVMTSVRSDQATCVAAFAKPDTPEIFDKISPRTNVRLPNPYRTDEVVLHVRANDPSAPLPPLEDERQKIIARKDDRDVTLKVSRVVPDKAFTLPLSNFTAEEKECLEPNPQIQFDDPEFSKLAKDALGDEKDAWKAAQKLELFTSKYISNKSLDSLFETATGVMKSKSGDCTEHGVFLAGLCRATGIPARVAVGFLYFQGIWGGHMWTEVSLGGKWYAIDGVLGQGSVDAAHLRLAADSLKSTPIERAFQNVALGMTMKIDLVSFRHGSQEVRVGGDFESFVVDGRKFASKIYDFSIEAPAGFTVKPNRNISLGDLVVVEFEREGGGARVEVVDVAAAFSLDEAKERVAGEGLTRVKSEERTVDGRPARILRGKKDADDLLVAAILDGQTLVMVTLPRKSDGDEKAFEQIVGSLKFARPAPPAAPARSGS
jgi:hypothetical protein